MNEWIDIWIWNGEMKWCCAPYSLTSLSHLHERRVVANHSALTCLTDWFHIDSGSLGEDDQDRQRDIQFMSLYSVGCVGSFNTLHPHWWTSKHMYNRQNTQKPIEGSKISNLLILDHQHWWCTQGHSSSLSPCGVLNKHRNENNSGSCNGQQCTKKKKYFFHVLWMKMMNDEGLHLLKIKLLVAITVSPAAPTRSDLTTRVMALEQIVSLSVTLNQSWLQLQGWQSPQWPTFSQQSLILFWWSPPLPVLVGNNTCNLNRPLVSLHASLKTG